MKYWKRVDAENKTTTVESYSHDLAIAGAIEINKVEFDAFIAGLPLGPNPRDLAKELDSLKATLITKGVITAA